MELPDEEDIKRLKTDVGYNLQFFGIFGNLNLRLLFL